VSGKLKRLALGDESEFMMPENRPAFLLKLLRRSCNLRPWAYNFQESIFEMEIPV
jgi:hypothetical protein